MGQHYYIAVNGVKTGPFTIEELHTKNIQRDTLMWTEGLDNWTKAEYISLLKEVIIATPPPISSAETNNPQQMPPPPTPMMSASKDKYFGYELAKRRERFFATLIESIIILIPFLILFGLDIMDSDPDTFGSVIVGAIFSAVLGAIFYPIWGGNLGHKIMGLKVISSENGEVQNSAMTGASREALKSVFGYLLIPVIWLLWDENKQNLYDKVVKTFVVKNKEVI